jgi:hypothetical protein
LFKSKFNERAIGFVNILIYMVSAFEGRPPNDSQSEIECIESMFSDEETRVEMMELLDGRLYD